MNGVAMNIKVDPNGQLTLSNERSSITVHPDGTIAVSSMDPVQLTGACQAKLDNSIISRLSVLEFCAALLKRIDKKK